MTPAVLVVDDEHDIAETCERLLRRAGYRVVTASSRDAALAALGTERFSLAIVDRHLPDGDGLEVLRAAQARALPVIVMTGYASPASRTAADQAGAAGYLAKPFSAQAFLSAVERATGSAAGLAEA